MPLAAPLMQRHRIFHSQDVEETRAFLHGKEYQFHIAPRQAKALDVQLNGATRRECISATFTTAVRRSSLPPA